MPIRLKVLFVIFFYGSTYSTDTHDMVVLHNPFRIPRVHFDVLDGQTGQVQLFQFLALEDDPQVVTGEDDALSGRFLRVYVYPSHQQRIGTSQENQDNQAHPVGDPAAQLWVLWKQKRETLQIVVPKYKFLKKWCMRCKAYIYKN